MCQVQDAVARQNIQCLISVLNLLRTVVRQPLTTNKESRTNDSYTIPVFLKIRPSTINKYSMIKELTDAQMEHLLRSQSYGRLGCGQAEELYIVPLSYVYDGEYIYGHSKEGMKISLMRQQSKVCFQVDEIQNTNNWWSILVWAEYEELDQDPLKAEAAQLLNDRFAAFSSSAAVNPNPPGPHMTGFREKEAQPILFRLKVLRKSGRSERS